MAQDRSTGIDTTLTGKTALDDRIPILLTEGSSSSARQALYSLSDYVVDIVDPSALCQCRFSRMVRNWIRCPSYATDPAAYLELLVGRISTGDYQVLLPTHEQVYLLSFFRESFEGRVGLAVPDFDTLRRTQSKVEFSKLLDEIGLPTPRFQIVRSEAELDAVTEFPCYLKLAHGTGGLGVKPVENRDDLRAGFHEFKSGGLIPGDAEVLVQQPALGTPGVVQSVFQQGRLIAAHCSENQLVGLGGGQMFRQSARHDRVWEDLRLLGEKLHWHGALFLDYFHEPDSGRIQYIEANPRLGETLSARLCGVNLCDLLVQISLGNHVQTATPTQPGVCSHNGFQVLLAKAIQGANRRELLAELAQLTRGTGAYAGCANETTRPSEDLWSLIPAAAVALQLLLQPKLASRIVENTIANYALPESGARLIEQLPQDYVEKCFAAR